MTFDTLDKCKVHLAEVIKNIYCTYLLANSLDILFTHSLLFFFSEDFDYRIIFIGCLIL